MANPVADIKIKADPSQLPSGLRAALKMVQGFVHKTTGLLDPKKHKDPDRSPLAFGTAVGGVAGQLAMRGIDMLVDQTKQVFDFNKELIRFGIDIRKMPSEMEAVGKGIREISNQTGLGAMEVLKAGRAYADLAGAESFTMEKMSLIARAAQASGADVKDMASLMFTLTENLKVPPGQLEDTIGGIVNQAKDGSIHFRELSRELVALGPVYAQFGITGREGAIQLGALMQIARRGFGSASEAGTGVLRILRSIPQHASKFRAAGIQVFEDKSKSKLENFLTIINRIKKSKLELDREKLMKAFGRTEGERFYQLLKDANDQFDKLITAGRVNGTVAQDLGTYTESSAGRIDVAVEKMKNAFAAALTPERVDQIVGGIERIGQALPPLMTAVGKISDLFGGFVHMVARAKNMLQGDSKYELTEGDQKALIDDQRANRGMRDDQLSGEGLKVRRRAQDTLRRKADYDKAIGEIMGEESDFGATDASVRKAILAARSDMGPNAASTQVGAAGRAYLEGRKSEISVSRYKRIEGEIAGEERNKSQVFGFDPMEKYRDAASRQVIESFVRKLAQLINDKPTTVNIDGNPVAKAASNATDRRRK